ncbi:unnamed protein product, partial [Tilletia controversa]
YYGIGRMLNNMASILERHRLLQSSLSSWLRAHTHHVHLAHSHAVFTRRSLRSLKKRTLAQWATALDALREKEEEALRFRVGSDLAHLRRCMALWMGREREMLFRRVSEGRSVSSAWGYWRKTLVEREGRYELQESILTERVRLGTLKTGWTALVSAFTLQNALGTAADALARKVSVERAFAKWRASSLHRWRLALPLAQSRRLATEFERRHLLPRFWAAWVGAAKVERNLRAAERFGGVGMRKFKSVSGRVRIGGVGVAVGVVVSPPGVGVGTSGAAAGGGAHHQGGGQGGARVGSPFSTASRRRRWSLGPPVPDEDDDDE